MKITAKDMRFAAKFCEALDRCPIRGEENCIFVAPTDEAPCSDCLLSQFKTRFVVVARPFAIGWQELLRGTTLQARNAAVRHLFFGIGALYSANRKKIPMITLELIQTINLQIQSDQVGSLRIILNDLKGLSDDWYKEFRKRWLELGISDNTLWIRNILLLKVFLEAAKRNCEDGF